MEGHELFVSLHRARQYLLELVLLTFEIIDLPQVTGLYFLQRLLELFMLSLHHLQFGVPTVELFLQFEQSFVLLGSSLQ